MSIEFSFTAFDDFPALKNSKSKQCLNSLNQFLRSQNIPVVYSSLIKMAALDAGICTKNIHRGLSERIATFQDRKQVLIHLFDNLSGPEFMLQDRGRNEASFTTDIRNFRPKKERINSNCELNHTLSTSLNIQNLKNCLQNYDVSLLNHEKLYLDNYIFYSSLTYAVNSGVIPLLVYIPYELQSVDRGREFIRDVCLGIIEIFN